MVKFLKALITVALCVKRSMLLLLRWWLSTCFLDKDLSQSLAARILDETGVYKNLFAGECTQRAGVSLPVYTTSRHGPGHLPVFKCTVRVAGLEFQGEAAKTKKAS
ncbi:hypothetical protein CY35_07G109200 [Sphagnum magellanicum]|uniref:Uncharacterized protein n=1 Tax=Sphagnum magellanicum TaxID=128215 RepID=A0ACB8HNY2_9BRYO|nr:hypothetical protein CY35_07G109200 [Sphagnum magellanicum]